MVGTMSSIIPVESQQYRPLYSLYVSTICSIITQVFTLLQVQMIVIAFNLGEKWGQQLLSLSQKKKI